MSAQRLRAPFDPVPLCLASSLLFLLLHLSGCGGDAPAPSTAVDSGSVRASAPALKDPPALGAGQNGGLTGAPALRDPRSGSWTAPARRIVETWVARAAKNSKGKAHAGNIDVGLHVVDLESGLVLADLGAGRARRPASNLKLVTTAAALVLFGPAAEFETPLEASGPVVDGRLAGDLVVRASGDPLIQGDSDPRVEPRLRAVARELKAAGLRSVQGDLVLDEGTFQLPGPGPAWPDPSQHWQEYCALSGGFSVNGGVLSATVHPTRAGEPARVELHPVPHGLRSIVRPRTVASGDLTIGGEARNGRVLVQGDIPAGRPPFVAEFSHPDPVAHFGAVLAQALRDEGIRLEGDVRRERNVAGGERLATLRSSVGATLFPINAHSRNGVADQLFLALGHALGQGGTRSGGQHATAQALELLGVSGTGLHQVDGSGLSFENAIAPAQITALLSGALRLGDEARLLFLESLAVAGEVGTLESRMRGTSAQGRVSGKTGWIRGTSSLSGVVTTLEGRDLVFSCLIEYPPAVSGLNRSVFKPMTDALCVFLTEEAFPRVER